MKYILLLLILTLVACDKRNSESHRIDFSNTEQLNEPKILDELLSSGRNYGRYDLVDHLYGEALKSDAQLKVLDDKIANIEKVRNEGLKEYNEFEEYNNSYYSTTDRYLNSIQDTVKREAMRKLMVDSRSRYDLSMSQHRKAHKNSYVLEIRTQ